MKGEVSREFRDPSPPHGQVRNSDPHPHHRAQRQDALGWSQPDREAGADTSGPWALTTMVMGTQSRVGPALQARPG